jgi:hypothetical protein
MPADGVVEMMLEPVLEIFHYDRKETVVKKRVVPISNENGSDVTGSGIVGGARSNNSNFGEASSSRSRSAPVLPRLDPQRRSIYASSDPAPNMIEGMTLPELIQVCTAGPADMLQHHAIAMLTASMENPENNNAWQLFFGFMHFVSTARLFPQMPSPGDQSTTAKYMKHLLQRFDMKKLVRFPGAVTHAQALAGKASPGWWWESDTCDGIVGKWPAKR